MNPAAAAAENVYMKITDAELDRRLREAARVSMARSKPAPVRNHVVDTWTFELVDATVGLVSRAFFWLGVAGLVVVFVVAWASAM